MSMNDPYAKYFTNQVLTASPSKLLIMSYDAAIRFSSIALERMKANNVEEKGLYIGKVQDLILNLSSALDPKVDQQLVANLEALYTFMFDSLTHANFRDDQKVLANVIKMLTEMRETWAEADKMNKTGQSSAANMTRRAA